MYWGADMAPNSKGCCSEAKTVDVERRGKRMVENVDMPRIVPAPHAIDTYRSRVRSSDCQVVTNRVLWMYAAQLGLVH